MNGDIKMTIRHFQIFKAVCDCDGATAAADRLNIAQPTVSIAIRELEAFYNTKLFDRISRKIYLTEQGRLLRQYVESVLSECDEVTAILRNGKLFSKCRLGVNISFAETHLARITKKIMTSLPNCDLQIVIQNNDRLEHMLSNNKIDLAIYDGTNDRSSKHISYLFKEKMAAVCSCGLYAESNIDIKTLSKYPLLLRELGSGVRTAVDKAFYAHEQTETIFAESVSTASLVSLAEQGLGFVFLPLSMAKKECKSRSLKTVDITDEEIFRVYYLAHNEKKHLTETMTAVKDIICKEAQ